MKEYIFRVVKWKENDFGFFPINEEETYELWDYMSKFFVGVEKKLKLVNGLMGHIRTNNYDGMLFWSENISNYVHETDDSPLNPSKTFKFVINDEGNFILSPYAELE